MTPKQTLVTWLRDAYAMEMHAQEVLERQDSAVEDYPELRRKIREHLAVTREQANRIERCLDLLGADRSALKIAGAQILGNLQGLLGGLPQDKVVKSVLVDFAFEQFEIGCYEALIVAAEHAGEAETRAVCEQILGEEREMADWLEDHMAEIVRAHLVRETEPAGHAPR